jgi:uncharacterized protein DUF4157/LysM domain-containing protein
VARSQAAETGDAMRFAAPSARVRPPPHPVIAVQRAAGNRSLEHLVNRVPVGPTPLLQRRCATGGRVEGEAPGVVREVLRSPGTPLDPAVRAFMEPRFGHDFRRVRIHTDARAAESARAVDALAYTVGPDVVFAAGRYAPGTSSGAKLLAHELTHTAQQRGVTSAQSSALPISSGKDDTETEARAAAGAVGEARASAPAARQRVLQRYEAGEHALFGDTNKELKDLILAKAVTRKVKPGETPRGIASRFKVPVETLEALNQKHLRSWPAADGSGRTVRGFQAGAAILIPPEINAETADALKGGELTFVVNGVTVPYSDGLAMADLYASWEEMLKAPASELRDLITLIDSERKGTWVDSAVWDAKTGGRYLKLALENEQHFAPRGPAAAKPSGTALIDHQVEWEKYHARALALSQRGNRDDAVEINAFGDHFLNDAFAGGHLFGKRGVMELFKSALPFDPTSGEFGADGKAFFDAVAAAAFTGIVKTTFSQYETTETFLGAHLNIDSPDMFSRLLQRVHITEPDKSASLVAKVVHDALNERPGGIPVTNAKGDSWSVSGDRTLNEDTKRIGRRAVARSQLNVLETLNLHGPLNLPALFKNVWDYVPRATSAGQAIIQTEIIKGTNPKSATLRAAAARVVVDNYLLLLREALRRHQLRKA